MAGRLHSRLCPVVNAKLIKYVDDMAFHCMVAYGKYSRDFGVGGPF